VSSKKKKKKKKKGVLDRDGFFCVFVGLGGEQDLVQFDRDKQTVCILSYNLLLNTRITNHFQGIARTIL
jgi:hypothetical protein